MPTVKLVPDALRGVRHGDSFEGLKRATLKRPTNFLQGVFIPLARRLVGDVLEDAGGSDAQTLQIIDIVDKCFAVVLLVPLVPLSAPVMKQRATANSFELLPPRAALAR